jgi:hypothetical protein
MDDGRRLTPFIFFKLLYEVAGIDLTTFYYRQPQNKALDLSLPFLTLRGDKAYLIK